jgi:hypothetical protein
MRNRSTYVLHINLTFVTKYFTLLPVPHGKINYCTEYIDFIQPNWPSAKFPFCVIYLFIDRELSPNFKLLKEPKNRFLETNSARLFSLAGRYDNSIPSRFLAHIDCLKNFSTGNRMRNKKGHFCRKISRPCPIPRTILLKHMSLH